MTCAGGRVTQINMINNNLNGVLPALTGLSQLTNVTL